VQPQLETSEATISLVGLEPGKVLSLAALRAECALVLPLSPRLEAARPLLAHQPARLGLHDSCTNTDTTAGLLVVCAQRASGS
jgi:hypothetical protein